MILESVCLEVKGGNYGLNLHLKAAFWLTRQLWACDWIWASVSCSCKTKLIHSRIPWWSSGKESACQCRGHGFDHGSRKIPKATGQLRPGTTTSEPTGHNCWRPCALSRDPQQEKALQWEARASQPGRSPYSPQLEKNSRCNEDLAQSK